MAERKKRPHESSPVIGSNGLTISADDQNKFMIVNRKLLDFPKVNIRDPEAVTKRLQEYFDLYMAAEMKPTVSGMAVALGMNRRTLWAIVHDGVVNGDGDFVNLPPESALVIKNSYNFLETMWESYFVSGKINPVAGIFLAKNNYDYRDSIDYNFAQRQDTEQIDTESIRARYKLDDKQIINADE